MRFQFDGNQPYQLRAIESVSAILQGQERLTPDLRTFALGDLTGALANRLSLTEGDLLANLRQVQEQNGIKPDEKLELIEEEIATAAGIRPVRFPNFSIEMETGTGKTYVYVRTALELHRRYGLRKFIVVVPSIPVREGVLKTLKITQEHLRGLYDNVAYRFTVYDSKNIGRVRQFVQSDCVEILVMTIDSFSKDDNVIRQTTDRLQGATPIHLIQSARPVLVLDEPQNMESEGRIRALAYLNPLFALRYSATHRNPYNLVYRLTPLEAYRQGLVKRIEVASVVTENDFNQAYVHVEEIRSDKKSVQAKIALHRRGADGRIKEKSFLFKPGESLATKAQRPEYETFIVDEVSVSEQVVHFRNGISLPVGRSQGADQVALFREQIRYTIEEHFRKQKRLRDSGIKVLSLFFIDRVENYASDSQTASSAATARKDGLYPGVIRKLFDEAFDQLKTRYPEFAERSAGDVQAAYFAQRSRKGGVSVVVDSTTGQSAEDRAAYNLIMRDKEKLLSFDEPVAFIFSHSALREGWDNPNVCQICTLNQSVSEVKKRQEVGRGMRLVVDTSGVRVAGERMNVLTVVANESYERFVATLQAEMEDAFGTEGAAPKPTNARAKAIAKRTPLEDLPEEFKNLWERIRQRTRYHVTIQTDALVADVIGALNGLAIDPPRIVAEKAVVDGEGERLRAKLVGQGVLAQIADRPAVPNLVTMLDDMLSHISPPIRLTRRTLARILTSLDNMGAAIRNPQEFASKAARVIRERAVHHLIDGIRYEKDGTWYEMSEWSEEQEGGKDRMIEVDKSIYDHIVVQSETEKRFAEGLLARNDVRLFVKLPSWFKVATPVGNYNPDWALVMEELDAHGDAGPLLYLVRETKGTTTADALRGTETQKIRCGERHFVG